MYPRGRGGERADRPGFLDLVRADVARYADAEQRPVTLPVAVRIVLLTPGFQFVLARRVQDLLYALPVVGRPAGRVWWWLTCRRFGSEIAIATPIGPGLYIPHPYGIVIGVATVGTGVTFLQNVTLGQRGLGEAGAPVIGDGAYVGAGAVILGDVRIGRGAVVGANSVVTRDVPDGATAVGSPARVLTSPAASAIVAAGQG